MRNKWCLPQGEMLIFGLGDVGLPEVHTVGLRDLTSAAPPLRDHDHPDTMEIKHVLSGERLYVMNGHEYRLRADDMLVTYPGERHGSGERPVRIGMQYWLGLRVPKKPEPFLGLLPKEAWVLIQELKKLPRRFKAHRHLRAAFEEIVDRHRSAPKKLKKTWVAIAVLNWLRLVIQSSVETAAAQRKSILSPDIQSLITMIEREPENAYDVDQMALRTGLSVSRFKARFREEIGVPPMQYVLRKKVEHAERLLNSGKSVTEVAYAMNFSSTQYFATVFRRHLGKSPRKKGHNFRDVHETI
jgi:AraC-like DNA-binding protein